MTKLLLTGQMLQSFGLQNAIRSQRSPEQYSVSVSTTSVFRKCSPSVLVYSFNAIKIKSMI